MANDKVESFVFNTLIQLKKENSSKTIEDLLNTLQHLNEINEFNWYVLYKRLLLQLNALKDIIPEGTNFNHDLTVWINTLQQEENQYYLTEIYTTITPYLGGFKPFNNSRSIALHTGGAIVSFTLGILFSIALSFTGIGILIGGIIGLSAFVSFCITKEIVNPTLEDKKNHFVPLLKKSPSSNEAPTTGHKPFHQHGDQTTLRWSSAPKQIQNDEPIHPEMKV